jgi:protein-disulfide isomerase
MQHLLIAAGAVLIGLGIVTKPKEKESLQNESNAASVPLSDANAMPTMEKAENEKISSNDESLISSDSDSGITGDLGNS